MLYNNIIQYFISCVNVHFTFLYMCNIKIKKFMQITHSFWQYL